MKTQMVISMGVLALVVAAGIILGRRVHALE